MLLNKLTNSFHLFHTIEPNSRVHTTSHRMKILKYPQTRKTKTQEQY